MIVLLEFMYKELAIVDELHINPITLRRWLVTGRDESVAFF